MPEFAANLSLMFTALPFLERFRPARKAGFTRVECLFPYGHPPAELKRRLDVQGQRLVLFNLPWGDWERGDRGLAADPGRVDEFRTQLPRAVEYALALGVDSLNCMAGNRVAGCGEARQEEVLVANLGHAARRLARFGLRLLVEPIAERRLPGFFLNRADRALALLERVGEANVFLNLHLHPAEEGGEAPAAVLGRHLDRIGHLQVDGRPRPRQPGALDYPALFRELDRRGYRGQVGLDFVPDIDTWAAPLLGGDGGFRPAPVAAWR
jgi:hydroxypyruvate isomerase